MNNAVKLVLALAMLAAAGVIAWYRFGSGEEEAAIIEQTHWICTASSCGKDYAVSATELARLRRENPDAVPPCPHCGSATGVLGVPCANCHKLVRPVGHGQLPPACPHCGKPPIPN